MDLAQRLARARRGGYPLYFIAQVQDVSERKAFEERLRHAATHDALTGLPNRAYFLERLEGAASSCGARRRADRVAVLFVDLDGFKAVNDSLGHGAGDEVLVESAERLRSCVRRGDVVCRFGGDEFAVLAEGVDRTEASVLAKRLVERIGEPVRVGGEDASVRASVGVAVGGLRRRRGELVRMADEAMYASKTAGGSAYWLASYA